MGTRVLITLALCLTAFGGERAPANGFFVSEKADGVWRSHGSASVSVDVRSGSLVVNNRALEVRGGRLLDVVAELAGPLRSYSGTGVREGLVTGSLRVRGVWPGIDARLQFRGGRLKLDWLVAAGADPGRIRFRY
ncbi:MAG: hypothetical protein SGI92_18415, partial [Bryobacteraceae bacterium]|nr:hypothetical protein [Bryobacteraceae bacterium]